MRARLWNICVFDKTIYTWPEPGLSVPAHVLASSDPPVVIMLSSHYNDIIMSEKASQITGVSILLDCLFRLRTEKASKTRNVTGLFEWNSSATVEFLAQRASNAENVFIWWRHNELWHVHVLHPKPLKINAPHMHGFMCLIVVLVTVNFIHSLQCCSTDTETACDGPSTILTYISKVWWTSTSNATQYWKYITWIHKNRTVI